MNAQMTSQPLPSSSYRPGNTVQMTWLIAKRQMVEAMLTRTTFVMLGFSLLLLTGMIWFTLRPAVGPHTAATGTGTLIAFYLVWVGLLNSQAAIGVAAGVFAGDKERGCLLPLLATPASNTALFAGKVLGAVLPALIYTAFAVLIYLVELLLFFGMHVLSFIPLVLCMLVLLLTAAFTVFGAVLASVISSRVSTFQSAQTYGSLVSTVLWLGFFLLVFTAASWGLWIFAVAVAAIYVLDIVLIILAAVTWRREEVIAKQ